jgi:tetratricopeptide (TPR) repeat protein
MDKKIVCSLLATTVFICLAILSWAATVPKEAQRHFDRGLVAVEVAKTPEDYEQAIEEFRKAQSLTPDWADVYYNLALIQEKAGKYGDAVVNFKKYLRLAPNSKGTEDRKWIEDRLGV